MSPVAEPDPHHLLLQVEGVGHDLQLLAGGLGVLVEGPLERDPDVGLDAGPLLPPPPDGVQRVVAAVVGVLVAEVAACVLSINNLTYLEWFKILHPPIPSMKQFGAWRDYIWRHKMD